MCSRVMSTLSLRIYGKLRPPVYNTISWRCIETGSMTPENTSNLPPNLVVFGTDKEKLKKRDIQDIIRVPEDCVLARKVKDCPTHRIPPRVFLHTFEEIEHVPDEAVELHPEVFADNPRIDFLYLCKKWQRNYREVDYTWQPNRGEMGKGRKKPWPQKGTGRARHGSTVAPQWKGGGISNGPRGPRTLFHKMNPNDRLKALTSALSVKCFQDDLLIFKNLNVPSPDHDKLLETFATRNMKENSILIVYTEKDEINECENICKAVEHQKEVNLMPLVGLNVWSLLHHDKLILTLYALDELESKITWNLHRFPWIDKPHNFYRDMPFEIENNVE
ncbi:large ribosomal subunit protein uL4m-like [Styela clava]